MNKRPFTFSVSDSICRGKSFRFLGEWDPNRLYINDEDFQDFVGYNGSAYACMENCKGTNPESSFNYWEMVCSKGEQGDPYILSDEEITIIENYILNKLQEKALSTYEIAKEVWDKAHPEGPEFVSVEEWVKNIEAQGVVTGKKEPFVGMIEDDPDSVVRYIPQLKDADQKTIARNNIHAAFVDDILVVDETDESDPFYTIAIDNQTLYNHALVYDRQTLDDDKIDQVQENLHIADESRVEYLEKVVDDLAKTDAGRLGDINVLNDALHFKPAEDDPKSGSGERTADGVPPEEEMFIHAINRIIYYLGDPVNNLFIDEQGGPVVGGYKNGIINTLNYIKDHLATGRIERLESAKSEIPTSEKESVVSYAFYREEAGDEQAYAYIDIPTIICENPTESSEGFDKAVWGREKDADGNYIKRGPEDLTIKLTAHYEGNSTDPESGELIKDYANAFTLYADIIEGSIKKIHLHDDLKKEINLVGYEHVLDTDFHYELCDEDTEGKITLTEEFITEHEKEFLEYDVKDGKIVPGAYVIRKEHLGGTKQLYTEATTLRQAINELLSTSEKIKSMEQILAVGTEELLDGTTAQENQKLLKIITGAISEDLEIEHVYYLSLNIYEATDKEMSEQPGYQATIDFDISNKVGIYLNYQEFNDVDPITGMVPNINFANTDDFDFKTKTW